MLLEILFPTYEEQTVVFIVGCRSETTHQHLPRKCIYFQPMVRVQLTAVKHNYCLGGAAGRTAELGKCHSLMRNLTTKRGNTKGRKREQCGVKTLLLNKINRRRKTI
jgi:hypothetical protein